MTDPGFVLDTLLDYLVFVLIVRGVIALANDAVRGLRALRHRRRWGAWS